MVMMPGTLAKLAYLSAGAGSSTGVAYDDDGDDDGSEVVIVMAM